MGLRWCAFLGLAGNFCAVALAFAQPQPIIVDSARLHPAIAARAMVASQERTATEVGLDVLRRGGNAVDAAVAIGFAQAVTLPRAGNLGGGGFMMIHLAVKGESHAIDYRERAPKAATPTMFLNAAGEPDPALSRDSALGIAVPGTVAGLALAHARFGSGRFTLAELIAPAILLARHGVIVDDDLADSLPQAAARLSRWPASRVVFMPQGRVPVTGERLVQADLAATLERIAERGPKGFYEGETAAKLVIAVRAAGGILSLEDLQDYAPVLRKPLRGRYRGHDIIAMPPPSSGGLHLIQLLNLLEGYDIAALGHNTAAGLHLMIEAMRLVYADRAQFLGDPDQVSVPVSGLMSKRYAEQQRQRIDRERATPSQQVRAGDPAPHEGDQTTHFSVLDAEGNAVSNTYTLNFSYGLGLVAEGTGVLLNNEMDDFAAKAGAANAFGLVQGAANLPGPGKRPLSSMAPTIVLKDGRVKMVTGSPGGSRIITITLQTILNVLDHGMNIAEAVNAPRIHHQWLPDAVDVENGVSGDTMALLRARGHRLVPRSAFGSASAVFVTERGVTGAADTRQRGTWARGY